MQKLPLPLCLLVLATLSRAPVAAPAWQRDAQPLLTNFNNMYNPCVVETGGAYRFRMWFFGWAAAQGNPGVPGCDAIFHARSKDLRHWEIYSKGGTWDATMAPVKWAPVVHASDRWYEAWHVGDPSVVHRNGRFHMAYSATSRHFGKVAGYPATMVQCILGATSEDGIRWTKTDAPLLIRAGDSAKPKPEPGRIGDFHRPCLRFEGGRWRLWFDYWLPGKGVCMGVAENSGDFTRRDGFTVQHDLTKPLLAHWPNPEVVRIGGRYHCFSDAPGYPIEPGESPWKRRQLREAVSPDGLRWRKLDFIPPDPDADACHVPQALVTEMDGKRWLYLFYATQIGSRRGDGKYHYQYDRIRAMRRETPAILGDPQIRPRLGSQKTLLGHGQHGLEYFPDGRLAFIGRAPKCRLLMPAGVATYLLEGESMASLRPVGKVLLPGKPGSFDNGYAGVNAVHQLRDGVLLAFYHAEDQEGMAKNPNGVPGFYCSVGLARSTDGGRTFTKLGPVLTSSMAKDPKGTADQGIGELTVVTEPSGRYLYAYYTSHSRVDGRGVQICMARCPVAEAARPGAWRKLHAGRFDQPGLGGKDTPVVSAQAMTADAFLPHVVYCAPLRRFAMVFCVNAYRELEAQPRSSGIYLITSEDGIHWEMNARRQLLTSFTVPLLGKPLAWQPTLALGDGPAARGWLYYSYTESWGHRPPHKPHYLVGRTITLTGPRHEPAR